MLPPTWAAIINGKSPTPQIIGWTEPWWKLVRYAAIEDVSRLNINGAYSIAGYEAAAAMDYTRIINGKFAGAQKVKSNSHIDVQMLRPVVNPRSICGSRFTTLLPGLLNTRRSPREVLCRDIARVGNARYGDSEKGYH